MPACCAAPLVASAPVRSMIEPISYADPPPPPVPAPVPAPAAPLTAGLGLLAPAGPALVLAVDPLLQAAATTASVTAAAAAQSLERPRTASPRLTLGLLMSFPLHWGIHRHGEVRSRNHSVGMTWPRSSASHLCSA